MSYQHVLSWLGLALLAGISLIGLRMLSYWWSFALHWRRYRQRQPTRFPRLRLINWFEQEKDERDVPSSRVDWTITRDPQVLYAFRRDLPPWLVLG